MGVTGLWEILKPTGEVRSLTDIAVSEGFKANPSGRRGFRIGIDASIWLFHAEYGKEGENPHLRTIFFRCATLMKTTFLPVFVFDGPKRPDIKRGKKISKVPNKLIPAIKKVVEAFGFEWRTAPGEAEAELAYLDSIGAIDGVLSDDVDNFLFGAKTVIRNPSNKLSGNRSNPALNASGKDDGNHTRVYRIENITDQLQLTRGGLVLIGLLSGGDYDGSGLSGCGMVTAVGLAKGGYGDTLFDAASTMDREELGNFLIEWREGVRSEIQKDTQKLIGRKQPSLAKKLHESFPDIDILLSYVKPITTETMGRSADALTLRWEKEPDLSAIAGVCEMYFEWGYRESIIKRFRTLLWHPIVLRILRRAILDKDQEAHVSNVPSTPRKKNPRPVCGTPSKMIAARFSSMNIGTPPRAGVDSDDEDDERLILGIRGSRSHVSTGGLLEYRLEVDPAQLLRLTEAGIKGTREAPGPDEWASDGTASGNDDDDEGKKPSAKKKKATSPQDSIRLWMPACMVEVVEPEMVREFQEKEEQKQLKKANKGTKAGTAAKGGVPKKTTSKKAKPVAPRRTKPSVDEDLDDIFDDSDHRQQLTALQAPAKTTSREVPHVDLDLTEADCESLGLPTNPFSRPSSSRPGKQASDAPSLGTSSTRPKVRDLTQKKIQPTPASRQLNSYFTVSKPSTSQAASKGGIRSQSADYVHQTAKLKGPDKGEGTSAQRRSTFILGSPKRKPTSGSPPSTPEPDLSPESPKKKLKARSVSVARPSSPSPVKPKARVPPEVIELTDDDESDDELPASILPPLLRAKARNAAMANVRAQNTANRSAATEPSSSSRTTVEIIDLT